MSSSDAAGEPRPESGSTNRGSVRVEQGIAAVFGQQRANGRLVAGRQRRGREPRIIRRRDRSCRASAVVVASTTESTNARWP